MSLECVGLVGDLDFRSECLAVEVVDFVCDEDLDGD